MTLLGPDLTTVGFNEEINSNKSKPLYVEYEVLLPGEYVIFSSS